jgi:hypothetical protein
MREVLLMNGYPRVPKVITDLPAYMRKRNADRRAMAKKLGVCIECVGAKAAPMRTKCQTCLDINAEAQRNRRAA